ncbi:hypothetical protein [Bradyrhizobium genosp. P]|uniref:hypothetical protein n=1 Tax=Bradyrhizobium genosp. P TaxID=83641 RepID=UPI003CED088C
MNKSAIALAAFGFICGVMVALRRLHLKQERSPGDTACLRTAHRARARAGGRYRLIAEAQASERIGGDIAAAMGKAPPAPEGAPMNAVPLSATKP